MAKKEVSDMKSEPIPVRRMVSNQPTQEQIKEFWEECGFHFQDLSELKPQYRHEGNRRWVSPLGEIGGLPDLDLNNLFKYAVPKLKSEYRNWKSTLHDWIDKLTGDTEKDTVSLFRIIQEVIKEV